MNSMPMTSQGLEGWFDWYPNCNLLDQLLGTCSGTQLAGQTNLLYSGIASPPSSVISPPIVPTLDASGGIPGSASSSLDEIIAGTQKQTASNISDFFSAQPSGALNVLPTWLWLVIGGAGIYLLAISGKGK